MIYVDMHTHTFYSDGTNSPRQIVTDCAMLGMNVMAVTDHDITKGYREAREEGKKWGIRVLAGVEVSTTKYHVLGYDFDIENKILQDLLAYSRECQEAVVRERVDKLSSLGVPITFEKIKSHHPESRLGKFNIVITMLQDPECREYLRGKSSAEIYDLYLDRGKPASKIRKLPCVRSKEAIDVIHKAGGFAIVAHPFKQDDDIGGLERLFVKGVDGLEIQPNHGSKNDIFREYAEENGLIITYGSDYHGANFVHRPLLNKNGNVIKKFWR
jgi:predicted metal-dependent phosphoesterase TrpH